MGLFSESKEEKLTFSEFLLTQAEASEELDAFIKEFNKIIDAHERNKSAKKEARQALEDMRESILDDLANTEPVFGGMAKRFEKYGGRNVPEMAALITRRLNSRYNYKDTNGAMWVDLKARFFEYKALVFNEITELKRLESKAEKIQADHFRDEAKRQQKELAQEVELFDQEVCELKPKNYQESFLGRRRREGNFHDDYYDIDILLDGHLNMLYQENGRTELLSNYNQYLKKIISDPQCVEKTILFVNKELSERDTLEDKTQAAQLLRANSARPGDSFRNRMKRDENTKDVMFNKSLGAR